jgi:hypothetical protein
MQLDITPASYKAINEVMQTGKEFVSAKGVWLQIHLEYNIGVRQGNQIQLDSQSRISIALLVKKQTDLDPRKDNYSELKDKSRTEVSKLTRHEKFISRPPREAFVQVRILNDEYCSPGYLGMVVTDVIELEMNYILSIENFDTFANIQRGDLDCLNLLATDKLVVVFAGDSIASPKAIKLLRDNIKISWTHFGDYDPAGILIAISRLKSNQIILPAIHARTQLTTISNLSIFDKQCSQLASINQLKSDKTVIEHISFIANNKVAVMQEQLIAHKIPLVLISLK